MPNAEHPPSYKNIILMAFPIILANSTTPLLGLVDTAVLGNFSNTVNLGAIAVGALIFSFVYWGFGFLRMSTTGFVAQAAVQSQSPQRAQQVISITVRALLLAVVIGWLLLILQQPLINSALWIFGASVEVEAVVIEYFEVRVWGAPATLATYVLLGYFIGNGLNKTLLVVQLILNGINIVLDVLFAGYLDMGAKGVAYGTLLAEWIALFACIGFAYQHAKRNFSLSLAQLNWQQILNLEEIKTTLHANSNIMIRTLFLLMGFALFTDQSARFDDATLACNHLLLQLISFSAFFLDGFAYVSEYYVGRAVGQKSASLLKTVVRRTTVLAGVTALLLSSSIGISGTFIVNLLTDIDAVRLLALEYLPFTLIYIALSWAAFQLDGIFIGATYTQALRNASILSTLGFLLAYGLWLDAWHNHGLWIAFIGFVILRAVFLASYYPALKQRIRSVRR